MGGLGPEDIAKLAAIARVEARAKKEQIYRDGEEADRFYFVLQGRVKIFKRGARGKEQILRVIQPGQSFAEVAMFAGETYPASAAALTPVELVVFPKAAFLGILRSNPELSLRLLGSIARCNRELMARLEIVSLRGVVARVASFLLSLAGEARPGPDGFVDLGMSKGELASQLGTVQATISRAFRKFKDDGSIVLEGSRVKVVRPDRLAAHAKGR